MRYTNLAALVCDEADSGSENERATQRAKQLAPPLLLL